MHMRNLFNTEELRAARFVEEGFSFTKGCPVLQIPKTDSNNGDFSDLLVHGKNSETARHIDNNSLVNAANFGDKLFDLAADPRQEDELQDCGLEARMANLLVRAMKENDSPQEQYARLGLPMERPITAEDIRKMHQRADAAILPEILTDKKWSKGGVNTYHALMRFIPKEQRETVAGIMAEKLSEDRPDEIQACHILAHLKDVVSPEYHEMIYYFVDLAGRTK